MAAAVLVVAAYACVPARAQSYGDFIRFNASHLRSDKYRKNSLDTVSWEGQRRKVHRRSDSSRASPPIKRKIETWEKRARGFKKSCPECDCLRRKRSVAATATAILAGTALLC